MLTRVPSDKQAEVQAIFGMTSILPTLVAPIASTTISAAHAADRPGTAYNYIALTTNACIFLAFTPFVFNWTYLYGEWNATPTGQQQSTALV